MSDKNNPKVKKVLTIFTLGLFLSQKKRYVTEALKEDLKEKEEQHHYLDKKNNIHVIPASKFLLALT